MSEIRFFINLGGRGQWWLNSSTTLSFSQHLLIIKDRILGMKIGGRLIFSSFSYPCLSFTVQCAQTYRVRIRRLPHHTKVPLISKNKDKSLAIKRLIISLLQATEVLTKYFNFLGSCGRILTATRTLFASSSIVIPAHTKRVTTIVTTVKFSF